MSLATTEALTAGFFAYLYREKQRPHLRLCATAWCLVALRSAVVATIPVLGPSALLFALSGWLMASAAIAFLWSVLEYVEAKPKASLLLSAVAGSALWSVAYRFHK